MIAAVVPHRGSDAPHGPGGELDYVGFCRAARRLTGVDLGQYRREQTERRVRAFARRRGADGLLEYMVMLRRDERERELFRDRVTVNVSQLWRNPGHWEFLGRHVLPELARRPGITRAWSAGCSYGAEPYTLAMLWREVAGHRPLSILATDIDEASIARARTATFTGEDLRDVPAASRERWLEPDGDDRWRVRAPLLKLVRFEVADVFARPEPEPASQDMVLCRNVVIYFTPERRNRAHHTFAEVLRPGGYLMVGATERVAEPRALGLRAVHPFIYRKDDENDGARR